MTSGVPAGPRDVRGEEEGLEAYDESADPRRRANGEEDPLTEAGSVGRLVHDPQHLAVAAEPRLLVGDDAGEPQRVDGDVVDVPPGRNGTGGLVRNGAPQ